MNEINTVIIDDEPFNCELIKSFISHLKPGFIVCGEAGSVSEGYKLIRRVKPDVVFLDIKMKDGTGFDLLNLFNELPFEVVFITGFDEYALKAFEYYALDYILKPVNPAKFSDTLKKLEDRVLTKTNYNNLKKIVESFAPYETTITKIPVHHHDKVMLLDLNRIAYIKAEEGCTQFYLSKDEKYTSSKQLSDFCFIVDNFSNFLRISKGTYINLNFVASYSKGLDCTITMSDGSAHEVPRRKKTQMLEAIQRLNLKAIKS
jgi:two-component system LytT family response regulator